MTRKVFRRMQNYLQFYYIRHSRLHATSVWHNPSPSKIQPDNTSCIPSSYQQQFFSEQQQLFTMPSSMTARRLYHSPMPSTMLSQTLTSQFQKLQLASSSLSSPSTFYSTYKQQHYSDSSPQSRMHYLDIEDMLDVIRGESVWSEKSVKNWAI